MSEIFNVFGIDWRLLFIQAVNFSVLLLVLWYFVYRPLVAIIEARRQKIEQGVADAKAAEEKLNTAETEKEEIVAMANREAEQTVEEAKQRARTVESEMISEARERGDRIRREADVDAEERKKAALAESQREIAQLAILSAEKVLRERKQQS